jgi:dehydratase
MSPRTLARRAAVLGSALAIVAVATACDPPTTVTTTVDYDCRINPNHILLGPFSDVLDADYEATAPQAVAPGGEMTVEITPEPFTIDGASSGGTISQISNVVWRVKIPTGASLTAHSIAGWENVGAGTPTSAVSGGNVVVTIPGPIVAGAAATLPTLTMELTATGATGSRIEPKVAGTSYTSPGLAMNAQVTGTLLGTLNPTLACFPGPAASPALHSTLISEDTAAPRITVTSPTAGQSVTQGSTVLADYACDDGDGVGVASCVGTVADGSPIDTSTTGQRTFTVTAADNEGKVSTKNVTYTVVAPG